MQMASHRPDRVGDQIRQELSELLSRGAVHDPGIGFITLTRVKVRGKAMSLKRFKDQVVVVTFGASWCEPCKKELPAYEKLAQKYQKRGAAVVFIAVNIVPKMAPRFLRP